MSAEADTQGVAIEGVEPEIDGGRFPIQRVVGERVVVEADLFAAGQEAVSCRLLYRAPGAAEWSEAEMTALRNDRWRGVFTVTEEGLWRYNLLGWVGADRRLATPYRELEVVVDRVRARFSTWYELQGDAEERLAEISGLGFDVLWLPPGAPAIRRVCEKAAEHGLEVALDLSDETLPAVGSWVEQGVRLFRVREPQTRPFPFWERLIHEVRREHPDVLFVAAAHTRPKVMVRLAKLGFHQLCIDFPSRLTRRGLIEAITDLRRAGMREVLRPHWQVSLPDPQEEPVGFLQRLILAATLGASYGLHGPEPEESLRELIARVNRIRNENPALQSDRGLRFHTADNDQILCYSRMDERGDNVVLVVVNLDPQNVQSSWLELPVEDLGLPGDEPFQVQDLLTGARYLWHGSRNFVQLDPKVLAAHIFRVRRQAGPNEGLR
jgi:hypothetical protein